MIIPLRFLLLNAGMVPSTLKVLLELIKVAYVAFIHHDEHFNRKDTPEDERVHCNSMSLCETLGNVRFLLTDKTGTLTRNELVLREMAVGPFLRLLARRMTIKSHMSSGQTGRR